MSVQAIEAGDGVGGTWLCNRYPGARCDLESIEYSYSFSPEIEREWVWSELMPSQPEIEAYLNFVAERLDLRRHIKFETKVVTVSFDEAGGLWNVTTDSGDQYQATFVICATGMLSIPIVPAIPGMDTFAGSSVFSSKYPREGIDFAERRVALIGTGSTGVQTAPILAQSAAHLYVFQRSAAYTFPTTTRPFEAGEYEALQSDYPKIRAAQREAMAGAARTGAFAAMARSAERPPLRTASVAEQTRAIEEFGVAGAVSWSDITSDPIAGEMARALYGRAVARIVRNPETAASLVPHYPFGCKRPIIDDGYYATFNRDNVTLVDLRKGGIEEITSQGIVTAQGSFDVDVIFYATGFDAMTGALDLIDIRGRDGRQLRDVWYAEGAASYLGLQIAGFPNFFIVGGLGGPGTLANVVPCLEVQIDLIADCIDKVRSQGYQTVEASAEAQSEWANHINSLVQGSVVLSSGCTSWWIGSNVPGKRRAFLSYAGGFPEYRRKCEQVAASGYTGFQFA